MVMVVGPYVVGVFGAATVAAVLPVTVPVVVIECIALTMETAGVLEGIRHALGLEPYGSKKFEF